MATSRSASTFQGGVRFVDGSLLKSSGTPVDLTLPSVANVLAGQIAGDGTIFSSALVVSSAAGTITLPTPQNQSANRVFAGPTTGASAAPTFRALVAGDIPALAYVTSVALTMPSIFSVAGSPITSSGTLAVTLATEAANTVFAGPTSGGAATPTFRSLVAADLAGLITWNSIQNATADLTLANAGFNTTFNQTSAVNWIWANTTAATASVSQSSPILKVAGTFWNGSASAEDNWTIQDVVANGTNGTSVLTFTHAGSTGAASLGFPAGTLGTSGAWGFFFNGTTVGFAATASVVSISTNATNLFPSIRFYAGGNLKGSVASSTASSVDRMTVSADAANMSLQFIVNNTTLTSVPSIVLGNTNGVLFAATTGTQTAVQIGTGSTNTVGNVRFAVSSGSANFVALNITPEINQTGTASGSYTALKVNVVETSLKGTSNFLLDLQSGISGSVSVFNVTNTGNTTLANSTAATSSVSQSSPIIKIAGTYWTGAASAEDNWTIQDVVANGTNGTSVLTFSHTGSSGITSLSIPAGSLGSNSGWGLTFTGTTIGITASGAILGIVTTATNVYPEFRLYSGSSLRGRLITEISGGVDYVRLVGNQTPSEVHIAGVLSTQAQPSVFINNIGSFTGTAAATQTGLLVGSSVFGSMTFAPTSGVGVFNCTRLEYTVNQTGGANGKVTGLVVNGIETAVGGTHLLLDLQAGVSGGTSKFSVSNAGTLVSVGGQTFAFVSKSANYTLTADDYAVVFSATATATLPASMPTGKTFRIKLTGASSTLTITPASGTIDGAASLSITTQYQSVDLTFDGTNWNIF